jgi:hypothetical protein
MTPDPGPKDWNLDYHYASGIFRGWLCNRCNAGIGMLQDDPERLEKAAAYLRARNPKSNQKADLSKDGTAVGGKPRTE